MTAGRIGAQAWVWDGVDDVMTVAAQAEINQLAALSLSLWVNPTSAGEGSAGAIMDKRGAAADGWSLVYDDLAGRTRCLRWRVDWDGGVLTVRTANNAVPAYNTGWYHVVLTWDGSLTATNVHIYVNGSEVGYQTQTNGIGNRVSDAAVALLIGNESTQASTFAGAMDHIRLFSHVLSPAEIASEYAAGAVTRRQYRRFQTALPAWHAAVLPTVWRSR